MPLSFDSLQSWHLWGAFAILLAVCEMLTVSFYLFCFAVAALLSAATAACGAPLAGQLAVFAASSFLCMVVMRKSFNRLIYRGSEKKLVNVAGMEGLTGVVTDDIGSRIEAGRVKLRGEEWRALSEEDDYIPAGQNVSVVSVAGATVHVRRI